MPMQPIYFGTKIETENSTKIIIKEVEVFNQIFDNIGNDEQIVNNLNNASTKEIRISGIIKSKILKNVLIDSGYTGSIMI